jgi:hypothetical protein
MVPFWKMLTAKRVGLQRKSLTSSQSSHQRMNRIRDYLRFWYPLKFDLCRMTMNELTKMIDSVIHKDKQDPTTFRPLVAIGHTKDLRDYETIESFLSYLRRKEIAVSTFEKVYPMCKG